MALVWEKRTGHIMEWRPFRLVETNQATIKRAKPSVINFENRCKKVASPYLRKEDQGN